jgi:hypothetical protein
MWDRMLDGYRTFPVLQKPFHRAELTDTLTKLLTPNELRVEPVAAIVAKRCLRARIDVPRGADRQ